MKKHSDYLNPFQPFAELELRAGSSGRPRDAIENNMCRAVFSALANSEPRAVAKFMESLAKHAPPGELREQTCKLANAIRETNAAEIEFGLQTWPKLADAEQHLVKVQLVGISTSNDRVWTHNQRVAPNSPCADAWIHVPGKLLLVFECKNDEHPLDATQISAYAHSLKLVDESQGIPRAEPGGKLESPDQARQVQAACASFVLDVAWSAVVEALTDIASEPELDGVGRWLCAQTREYIEWHVRPPYRGVGTIVEWLGGPDSPDRRAHLRRLVTKLGNSLQDGPISFAKRKLQRTPGECEWELCLGASAAVFVRLLDRGKPLTRKWLGKDADAQIWFQFALDEPSRIGLGYYVQAKGSQAIQRDVATWNSASANHVGACADDLERAFEKWVRSAPAGSRVSISAVKFRGLKKNWMGGGETAHDVPMTFNSAPEGALEFLRANRAALWCFPKVGVTTEVDAPAFDVAAKEVRKPDLEVTAPINVRSLTECGDDPIAIQAFLMAALGHLAAET